MFDEVKSMCVDQIVLDGFIDFNQANRVLAEAAKKRKVKILT